jgi:hypothetical protein
MSEDSQIVVPPSFVALFVPPGRIKPTAGRDEIGARYELCEDLAQMLTETARDKLWQLGITEADVLARMHAGLRGGELGLAAAEAGWVVQRLAELLEWPMPVLEPPPAAAG